MSYRNHHVILALVLLFALTGGLCLGAIPDSQRQALIALYNATGGDSWTYKSGWKDGELHTDGFALPGTEGTWYGIGTDAENLNVTMVSIGGNALTGSIPDGISALTALQMLNFSNNALTGSIPASIGTMTSLQQIFLSYNQLSGSIPAELGNLTNLYNLYLPYNQFTGSIPTSLGNLVNLQQLWLAGNQLTGSIPTELGNLTKIQLLYLQSNQLAGSIPASLGNLIDCIELMLYSNALTGSVPPELGNMTKLQRIWLTSNSLTGTIPSELGNWDAIRDIQFGGNQLSGSIPASFGNLTTLTNLTLYTNQLSGSIPPELGNMTALSVLFLSNNQLSGTIPTALAGLSNLTNLSLGNNNLTGSIPAELGGLTRLNTLDLRNNQLSGVLPASIGNLTALRYLYLNGNMFAGPVPAAMANLTLLSYTDLAYNAFYSPDPSLVAFLNAKDPDWASTQTVAPVDVMAEPIDGAAVRLTWTPIAFTAQSGCYLVYHAQTEGGPYGLAGQTSDKSASTFDVTGLNQGQTYYFVVQAHTDPHPYNYYKNSVDSENSAEVSAVPWLQVEIAISGTVTLGGAPLPNVLMAGLPGGPVTDAAGVYQATVPAGWSGTVTPDLADHTFVPTSRTYTTLQEDQTGQDFAATFTGASITVTAPNGGESWPAGTIHDVTWTQSNLTGTVTVDLYKGGVFQETLGTPDAIAGTLAWTIGAGETPGADYRILVWQGGISDQSDGDFAIGRRARVDLNNDGQEDILWRYQGNGAYQGLNVVWLMDQSESPLPLLLSDSQALAASMSRPLDPESHQASANGRARGSGIPAQLDSYPTFMDGGKAPTLKPENVMVDPVNTRGGLSPKDRARIFGEGLLNVPTRKDAVSAKVSGPGATELAGLQRDSEVIFSQVADTAWEIAGTGDFNGDGSTDILWRYYGTGAYQGLNDIWYMNGTVFVSESVFSSVPDLAWRIVGTGDFNGDGETDILWRYHGTGDYQGLNVIWFMNRGVFVEEVVFSAVTDTTWHIVGTGDFNGDGETDLLWRNYGTGPYQGLNVAWHMNNATFMGEDVFSAITDTAWEIVGAGDFNKDGQTDILWRYYGVGAYQGLNDIWYMQGTAFVREEVFSVVPDLNWKIVNR